MELGPSPRHTVSFLLILDLQTAMVSPQFHIKHDDFFETVHPSAINPPSYFNWQALSGLRKHEQSFREPINTAHQRAERPESIIAQETQMPLPFDREESESPMEDLPPEEEELLTSEGEGTQTPS